jgi:AGZA family xanthine/uracil permease-like MFS transporter
VSKKSYRWAAPGDVNAFFGLMLDNIADLLLTVGLLSAVFGFPTNVALRYMVPGTAIGVLVGDLLFFWMAIKVARRTGRNDLTAMPLGLDTPSTFGMVFFVLGPAFLAAKASGLSEHDAAIYTWQIGICSIFISGLFKVACAFGSNWIRRVVPRAGLLGSLAAIALVLISFVPLLEVLHHPVVGLVALAIILTTLVAKVRFPFRVPGALAALLVAGGVYYLMMALGVLHGAPDISNGLAEARQGLLPYEWMTVFKFEWTAVLGDAIQYMPVVIPFALVTVIGGIDCTESAAAAGDEFNTGQVIGVEAIATLVASLCGGVIQTTPYIGHPAYKAMGGRAAYTLATAIFVGGAGLLGYFAYLYVLIPKPTVFPILIFVGLEISAQSFLATPRRHYTAVVLACVPALAALAMMFVGKVFGDPALIEAKLSIDSIQNKALAAEVQTLRILSNGFIVTSLLWASALAAIIDRRLSIAATFFAVTAAATLFGVIHSPYSDGHMFFPWQIEDAYRDSVLRYTIGYLLVAGMMIAWGWWRQVQGEDTADYLEVENDA